MRHTRFVYSNPTSPVSTGSEVDALSDGYGRLLVAVSSGLVNTQYQSYSHGGSTALKSSATLPGSGAFTSIPTAGADGTILVPQTAQKVIVYISYTRGASSGQAAHKFYGYNGTDVGQLMSLDGTYNQINGAASISASAIVYIMTFDVSSLLYFGMTSAEIGVTGTPGTVSANITFG